MPSLCRLGSRRVGLPTKIGATRRAAALPVDRSSWSAQRMCRAALQAADSARTSVWSIDDRSKLNCLDWTFFSTKEYSEVAQAVAHLPQTVTASALTAQGTSRGPCRGAHHLHIGECRSNFSSGGTHERDTIQHTLLSRASRSSRS